MHTSRRTRRAYLAAGRRLGLRFSTGFGSPMSLAGVRGGSAVSITEKGRDKKFFTELRLSPPGLPRDILLAGAPGGSFRGGVAPPQEDLVVGDPAFDVNVLVGGAAHQVLSRLDRATRALVLAHLRRHHTQIADGSIVREAPLIRDPDGLVTELLALEELAADLARRVEPASALAENASTDPVQGVRLRNLAVLQDAFPGSPEAEAASRQALASGDPELRLQGAAHLGDEAFDTLLELAAAPDPERHRGDPPHPVPTVGVPAHVQVGALRHLLHRGEVERLVPVLRGQLERGAGRPRSLAIQAVGQLQLADLLPLLRDLVAEAGEETACALADAFARLGGDEVEEDLLRVLRHPAATTRQRAALGLARWGTARAVAPLREAVSDVEGERFLARAVEQSVAAIQARAGDAAGGRLSLATADGDEGALSLAETGDRGALSPVDTP